MDGHDPGNISKGDVYSLMADTRRRHVVRLLLEESGEWEVEALARRVAARERECSPTEGEDQHCERILLSLVHSDLLKLAAEDVVVFDGETVAPDKSIDDLAPLVK